MSGKISAALALLLQAATSPVLSVQHPGSTGVCPHPKASAAEDYGHGDFIQKGRQEVLKQPESFVFVPKQLYLILIYSHIQAQICLVEKVYCVCVCFLHRSCQVSALD